MNFMFFRARPSCSFGSAPVDVPFTPLAAARVAHQSAVAQPWRTSMALRRILVSYMGVPLMFHVRTRPGSQMSSCHGVKISYRLTL